MRIVGFDSAWADNPRAPGALCAVRVTGEGLVDFHPPQLVGFTAAAALVNAWTHDGAVLLAIDQPTIVPNATGARPVDRVAASVISFAGGGVQPASRGRVGLFDDAAPLWHFLAEIAATHEPEAAREATNGCHAIEVFPALALLSLDASFFGRKAAPRYNPVRPTYKQADWQRVGDAARREAARWPCPALHAWLAAVDGEARPRKADQDRLDAVLCLLVALRWRLGHRSESMMIGDTECGFIIAPTTPAVRARIEIAAHARGVPVA